ncbi:MAG: hypothetical protein QOI89_2856 [Solirubrobacteraceae bacterium]|jgi:hypothetical protein|nr:hypothetical protein [Solirubrobacteraceae bacterium]
MTTRTIVTSQPDVACDVCERRLLRGEHSDVFLATGRRRIVCELCAPRAMQEGWLRETDRQSVSLPPLRPRRGRSLLERLLHVGRPAAEPTDEEMPYERQAESAVEPEPYDFLAGGAAAGPLPAGGGGADAPGHEHGDGEAEPGGPAGALGRREPPSELDRALNAFNASEYPRRVAGVARSLGDPEVNVRSAEHAVSVVRIVVAWELCWYQYEVDLDEPENGARVAAQGTELTELAREDRVVNAVADDSGALSLSAA